MEIGMKESSKRGRGMDRQEGFREWQVRSDGMESLVWKKQAGSGGGCLILFQEMKRKVELALQFFAR
jgi:hypothetical protein